MGIFFFLSQSVLAFNRGLYLTQYTAMNASRVNELVGQAKKYGIDTFIIDQEFESKKYRQNIQDLVKKNGIQYVARVVIFPNGGHPQDVKNPAVWEQRWKLMQYALSVGADQIQLDYIRYKPDQPPLASNVEDISKVVQFFRDRINEYNKQNKAQIKLQMDVFGITSHKAGLEIGQDDHIFANQIDAVCPMLYPSHFEPYLKAAVTPYETVKRAIVALKAKVSINPNIKIYAYIENFNYRYPMSKAKRIPYTFAQMKAAHDAGADGWYMWSANNKYDLVFQVLASHPGI